MRELFDLRLNVEISIEEFAIERPDDFAAKKLDDFSQRKMNLAKKLDDFIRKENVSSVHVRS